MTRGAAWNAGSVKSLGAAWSLGARGRLGLLALARSAACGSAGPGRGSGGRAGLAPLQVSRGALEDRMVLTGELEALAAEQLRVPRTPAWTLAISWLAEDGALVKKGEKVVEFDSTTLAESLDEKRSATVRADNELMSETARAAADLADKAMQVERASAELEKKLIEAGVPADLEAARTHQEKQLALLAQRDALAKAKEELLARQRTAQLDRTVKEVERARAARELAELEKRLDDLVLRASRDDIVQMAVNPVVGRKYLAGDQAIPSWVVASLPELGTMQVHGRLSDVDDGAVRTGMKAECTLDAYPHRRFSGSLEKVSPMARSEGRDVTRRFFDVIVTLDKAPPELLRPGMSVRVEVIRRRVSDATLVPRAALVGGPRPGGKSQVRLVSGELQAIEMDFCSELTCAVRAGLSQGSLLAAPLPTDRGSL
jgi:multidrug efflux pump subunit AcrA (membrane-fusion protein)